jgi:hypothetical protein
MEIVTMLTPSPQKVRTSPVCPKNKRKNDSDWASQDQKNVFGNLSPEIAKRRLIMENVHDEVGHVLRFLDGVVDAVENIMSNFQLDHTLSHVEEGLVSGGGGGGGLDFQADAESFSHVEEVLLSGGGGGGGLDFEADAEIFAKELDVFAPNYERLLMDEEEIVRRLNVFEPENTGLRAFALEACECWQRGMCMACKVSERERHTPSRVPCFRE